MLRIGRLSLIGAVYVSILLFSTLSFAAETPKAGTILKQQEQREQSQRLPAKVPEEEDRLEAITPTDITSPAGPVVKLKNIRITGGEEFAPKEELQAIVDNAVGKELGIAQMKQLASKVSAYLQNKGYLLAQAYLPQQDVSNGDLEIVIVDGRIDGTSEKIVEIVAKDLRLDSKRIQEMFSKRLSLDKTVKKEDLERVLLLLNDLPGISARAALKVGRKPQTARIVTKVEEGEAVSGITWVDNYGSRYSGAATANAQLNLNDPLGIGDRMRADVSISDNQYSLGGNYSFPVGYDGIRLNGGGKLLEYKIGKELSASEAEGLALTFNLGMSYPLIRSRYRNVFLNATYNNKLLRDKVLGFTVSKRKVNSLQLGVSADQIDQLGQGGISYGNLFLTTGDIDLADVASDYQSDQLTAKVHGDYVVLNGAAARLQRVFDSFSLFGQIQGQLTNSNLDSSEQFSLGGPTGVRAYPVGEASGDEGVLINAEIRYDMPTILSYGNIQISGFMDYGLIRLNKNPWANCITNASGKNGYSLAGAGFGISLVKSGAYSAKLQVATTIGDNDGRDLNGNDSDGLSHDVRAWFTASYQF